ncbi:MAG: hypothetical protein R3234_00905 [Thermoanaerobaculia bacterium]|nr:hypothetical protein [Thermoanaerobaculia bacterium]
MATAPTTLDSDQARLPEKGVWKLLPTVGMVTGVVFLLVAGFLAQGGPERFFHSYLVSWVFFLSLALGGLFFVLLQHLTRAGWSVVVRRVAEDVAGTLPFLALLFVPLIPGIHSLYHWSHEEAVAEDPLLAHKAPWLDEGRFLAAAVLCLGLWSLLAWWYRRESRRQDESGEIEITERLQRWSALAMIVYGVTQSVAAFDWLMSLDAHWYSTIYGVYFFSGSTVGILALLIGLALILERQGALRGLVTFEHYHDLGKLLFGFVVFWAYIAFSQFMLIWYAAIPEETLWYARRWEQGWRPYSIALAVIHFGIPFFFLLFRDVKRRRATLALSAIWLLVAHYLDVYWLVMPALLESPGFHLQDLLTFVGVGALFVGVLARLLRRHPVVPLGDPRLAESLAFENV